MPDSRDIGLLKDAEVVRLEQGHHAIAGHSARESTLGVTHFRRNELERVALEGVCPLHGVAGGDESEIGDGDLQLTGRDGWGADFVGEPQRAELHLDLLIGRAEVGFEIGVARPFDPQLIGHFLLGESLLLPELAEFLGADPFHA